VRAGPLAARLTTTSPHATGVVSAISACERPARTWPWRTLPARPSNGVLPAQIPSGGRDLNSRPPDPPVAGRPSTRVHACHVDMPLTRGFVPWRSDRVHPLSLTVATPVATLCSGALAFIDALSRCLSVAASTNSPRPGSLLVVGVHVGGPTSTVSEWRLDGWPS